MIRCVSRVADAQLVAALALKPQVSVARITVKRCFMGWDEGSRHLGQAEFYSTLFFIIRSLGSRRAIGLECQCVFSQLSALRNLT